jgi:hypothetical protein
LYSQGDVVLVCEGYIGDTVVTFTRENFADPFSAEGGDYINPSVTLTRGSMKALCNITGGDNPGQDCCGPPTGTEWKWGDFNSPNSFTTWRNAVIQSGTGPRNALNSGNALMTMYIPDLEVYFEIEWHSWSWSNSGGGFSYTRRLLIEESGCELQPANPGCTNPSADNYDPAANIDDGSCIIGGCTDPESCHYNPQATYDNGTCFPECPGCTNPNAHNFDPLANINDGSCTVLDCLYDGPKEVTFVKQNFISAYFQYDEIFQDFRISRGNRMAPVNLTAGDIPAGTCCGPPTNTWWKWGSSDIDGIYTNWRDAVLQSGTNIRNALSNQILGTPVMSLYIPAYESYFDVEWINWAGGNSGGGFSYKRTFRPEFSECDEIPGIPGCTDPEAQNYDANANLEDESCIYPGCTNPDVCDFNPQANLDDGSCSDECPGCVLENAINYNPIANVDDGSCQSVDYGCSYTGPLVHTFSQEGGTDPLDPANQDIISGIYSLARGASRALFNPALEGAPLGCCGYNPVGMLWKWGPYESLQSFDTFRDAVYQSGFNMRNALRNGLAGSRIMTLYIPNENWYFEVEFHSWESWTQGGDGGFSYTRRFLPEASGCEVVSSLPGCPNPEADNYNPWVNYDDGSCVFAGCMDPFALNFDPTATTDNGSCIQSCAYPEIYYTTFCSENDPEHFYVEFSIEDLGNAAPYLISDNLGSEFLYFNFTGNVVTGPFENNVTVLFQIQSLEAPCFITSPLLSIDCSSVGIESDLPDGSPGILLYPNPNNGEFILENKQTALSGVMSIRDIQGREVFRQLLRLELGEKAPFRVADSVSPGAYLVTITTNSGIQTLRLIIQ